MSFSSRFRSFLSALIVLACVSAATAQIPVPAEEVATPAVEPETAQVDPFGRETPRGMVSGLIDAIGAGNPELATAYLDLSEVPEPIRESRGPYYVRALETVLDRSGAIVPDFRLSADPEGLETDTLEAGVDVFAEVRTEDSNLELTAHRVEAPDGTLIWLVSPETLETVQELAVTTPVGIVDRLMPAAWSHTSVAGAPVSHWLFLALMACAALLLSFMVTAAAFWLAERIWRSLQGAEQARFAKAVLLPLRLFIACVLISVTVNPLGLSIVARDRVGTVVGIVAWAALAVLAWRAVDGAADMWLSNMSRRGRQGAISVVILLRRVGKIVVCLLAALAIFDAIGLDLTSWLAALGIGGLAIAFGAQKTVEHFVGSLSIVADRPIRVGDFCQVDGLLGTIEDIGMRSTRIRTLERTVVTIPNGTLSSARIENFASRDQYLFKRIIALRYDTTPEQMRAVLWRLRTLLDGDSRVTGDPARVRFLAFSPSSLDIEIFAYFVAADYDDSLTIAEELNLGILEAVRECGTSFAFPSQTVYVETETN